MGEVAGGPGGAGTDLEKFEGNMGEVFGLKKGMYGHYVGGNGVVGKNVLLPVEDFCLLDLSPFSLSLSLSYREESWRESSCLLSATGIWVFFEDKMECWL